MKRLAYSKHLADKWIKLGYDQLFGRTEQNRVVVFDRGTHRVGDFVMVKVTESSSATLKGEEVAG